MQTTPPPRWPLPSTRRQERIRFKQLLLAGYIQKVLCSVADPHHFDADPDYHFYAGPDSDLTFYSDADSDPTFQFDADPDPTTHSRFEPSNAPK